MAEAMYYMSLPLNTGHSARHGSPSPCWVMNVYESADIDSVISLDLENVITLISIRIHLPFITQFLTQQTDF